MDESELQGTPGDEASGPPLLFRQAVRYASTLFVAGGELTVSSAEISFQPKRRDQDLGVKPWDIATGLVREVRLLRRWQPPIGGLLTSRRVQILADGQRRTLIASNVGALQSSWRLPA